MLEDKYIGLIIALLGQVGIGGSFILTKKVRPTSHISLRILLPSESNP